MSRRPHHHRQRYRHRLRTPRRFYLGVVGLFAIAICIALVSFSSVSSPSEFSAHLMLRRALDFGKRSIGEKGSARQSVVYPYSIIAGGVHSEQELRQAIRSDPVTAAQYAKFDLAKTIVVTLRHDEYAYVSFRVGDDVYWTRNKVKLHRGESLITDGKNFGRTRCGNRLSKTARLPFYQDERLLKTLDAPVKPAVETEAFAAGAPAVFDIADESPADHFLPTAHERASTSTMGFTGLGFAPVFPPPDCDPAINCANSKKLSPPSPPLPSPTPETSDWILLGTGLAALTLYWALKRRMEITD